jgi:phenylalanyl-tRNA synthetase beta chain
VRRAIGDATVPEVEMRTILEGLGCIVSPSEHSGWRVTAPTHRPDLGRPIDLVEEVARVRGYDRVPTLLLRPEPRPESGSRRALHVRAIRRAAMGAGHHEAVNFTFVSPGDLVRARVSTDAIALANPLSEERSVMRTSLVPGLLANVSRAERHQRPVGRIFEIGKRYSPAEGAPAREVLTLGLVAFGPREQWLGEGPAMDFYDGKGAIERIFGALGLSVAHVATDALPAWLHPRRAAEVHLGQHLLGHVGEIHPDVADAHDLVTRPVLAELDLELVIAALGARGPRQIAPLPRQQAVLRDLALVLNEGVAVGDLVAVVRAAGAPLVERVDVFDVYRGKPIAEGHKSVALRLTYRDPEVTLTDARVDAVEKLVLAAAERELGARLRAA